MTAVKSQRQAKILEIISTINVETQEQLLQELEQAGFRSTQATISRDIKELRIVKELTTLGTYRYTTAAKEVPTSFSNRLNTIFRECVTRYDYAQNLVVVKCYTGMANAACAALDSIHWEGVVGTIAGDDTILVVMRNEAYAEKMGFIVSNDTGLIESVVKAVVAADPASVAAYKGGREKALMALFGKCMKELRGNCDPQVLRGVLLAEIEKA